jgi:acyl-CoA thioester hydrolase
MDFTEIGFILADAHVTYLAPVTFGQELWVGVRTTRLGNKSLTLEYSLEERKTKQVLATGTTIVVAYDYHNHQTIPVPEVWRSTIADFEGLERS